MDTVRKYRRGLRAFWQGYREKMRRTRAERGAGSMWGDIKGIPRRILRGLSWAAPWAGLAVLALYLFEQPIPYGLPLREFMYGTFPETWGGAMSLALLLASGLALVEGYEHGRAGREERAGPLWIGAIVFGVAFVIAAALF